MTEKSIFFFRLKPRSCSLVWNLPEASQASLTERNSSITLKPGNFCFPLESCCLCQWCKAHVVVTLFPTIPWKSSGWPSSPLMNISWPSSFRSLFHVYFSSEIVYFLNPTILLQNVKNGGWQIEVESNVTWPALVRSMFFHGLYRNGNIMRKMPKTEGKHFHFFSASFPSNTPRHIFSKLKMLSWT